jgi:hypothetical protein
VKGWRSTDTVTKAKACKNNSIKRCLFTGQMGRLFRFLTLLLKDFHNYASFGKVSKNGPWARRRELWRWGNTSRRRGSWRRGWTSWQQMELMWRWRGCRARRRDLCAELGAKICGAEISALVLCYHVAFWACGGNTHAHVVACTRP